MVLVATSRLLAWLDDEVESYWPQTVDNAWLNHFEAFGGMI